ncbi:MAG TPA: hypothetical protein EYM37_00085 [Methylophaga aminisulfidivorans]|jgi:hypothetical protein|uniref:hypothetical protein n=1 Tax=Methylophaga TaxID=40222 RepID=UPI0017747118|nr:MULTISPECIES: hypothetical protein [Methylophaga]HIC48047.1 hypothetical protein [Methylophaga sp.]HIM38314.1 hypothetical protein [Methylophaga aminisulfidivorans]
MLSIAKPDEATLKTALNNAELMIETGHDHQHVAQALLYMDERNHLMSNIVSAVENYFLLENSEQARSDLLAAFKRLKTFEIESAAEIEAELTLDQS